MRHETGIGWDHIKKTVDAMAEWWESKFTESEEYRKFHDMRISPEMMEMYDKMFKGSTALGDSVMIPSAFLDVEEIVEDSEHVISINDEEEDPELVQNKQNRGKKRATMDKQTGTSKDKAILGEGKRKKEKVGGAAKLAKKIDRLVDVVESRSTATSVPTSAQGTSIQEVMRVVATLPGAETGTKLWWFVIELFCSQEKREMFSIMTNPDLKLQFFILNQKKADHSFVM